MLELLGRQKRELCEWLQQECKHSFDTLLQRLLTQLLPLTGHLHDAILHQVTSTPFQEAIIAYHAARTTSRWEYPLLALHTLLDGVHAELTTNLSVLLSKLTGEFIDQASAHLAAQASARADSFLTHTIEVVTAQYTNRKRYMQHAYATQVDTARTSTRVVESRLQEVLAHVDSTLPSQASNQTFHRAAQTEDPVPIHDVLEFLDVLWPAEESHFADIPCTLR
eukprot:NODE_4844_length_733_cov_16.277228_g4682_i0.p2 GENE.NODE_4844_length_733_cov_16.277228_g4682_i0~~NODE_4844_length_733_cov_16.277228_g4682_i0.p2  ORF type:complete len:243 (-),score=81.30 NODE_4844_length_733_cov_16.277228_g4682_i0:3-671(-)